MFGTQRQTVSFLVAIVVVAVAAACSEARLPPTTLTPPVIEMVGLVSSNSVIGGTSDYTLIDGRSFTVTRGEVRLLGEAGLGGLVILGRDQGGRFLGGFYTQGGMPAGCFVSNAPGVDRGSFVELRGVLWRKAPDFVPAQFVRPDYAYPGGTRFCFNAGGLVSGTVAS